MTTTLAPPRMTVDEYFALEMATEYPNEYRAGEIVPIDRTEFRVSLIKVPLLVALRSSAENGGFESFLSFRVRIPAVDAYLYPDVIMVADGGRFMSHGETDTILDPVLVIDVLSERPSHADPEWRAEAYRTLDTIREYVLVASDRPHAEVYRRGPDGEWVLAEARAGLEESITLASIGTTVALAAIYTQVREFIADSAPDAKQSPVRETRENG
ncbi:MAG TPA: Uma2 family endonuclease [Longimicrobium sp.]|nr:Uma2 family endonuclease [Longimicrobium sp.]